MNSTCVQAVATRLQVPASSSHGGLRLQGLRKKGAAGVPLVSVVIAVRNAKDLLLGTMESVLKQNYPHVELIIIDGSSTDGTLDIIKEHEHLIDYWMSEPDAGVYYAMNKGRLLADGDFLWFINAGDTAASHDVLAKTFSDGGIHDYYYGNTQLLHPTGRKCKVVRAPEQLTLAAMYRGMAVSHQSIIVRRIFAPPYDTRYRLIADQKWIIQVIHGSRSGKHTGLTLSSYLLGGMSDTRATECVLEKMQFTYREASSWHLPALFSHHLCQLGKFWLKTKIRKVNISEAG